MNKQEVLKKLEEVSKTGCTRWVVYDEAKELIEQINEPERVKLTKAQEDYLLGFGDIENEGSLNWTAALYYIVRVGWGYLFTTAPGAGDDEIPLNSDYYKKLSGNLDVDDLKTLLIKALVNGYEVEKEKTYTARLNLVTQNKEGFLNKNYKNNDYFIDDLRVFSGEYQTSFTQSELEELNVWDNPVFEVEEVSNE